MATCEKVIVSEMFVILPLIRGGLNIRKAQRVRAYGK